MESNAAAIYRASAAMSLFSPACHTITDPQASIKVQEVGGEAMVDLSGWCQGITKCYPVFRFATGLSYARNKIK